MKENFWIVEIVLTLVAFAAAYAVRKWMRERDEESVRESLGAVKGLDVDIVTDLGRDRIGLTFPGEEGSVRVLLSPQQARLLVGWLRIAATKGRTLTMARVNYRRGSDRLTS